MTQKSSFGLLFADLMKRRDIKPTPLMKEANRLGRSLESVRWSDLTIDQIKGWRRENATGANDWLQLIAVLNVLRASAAEVEELLDYATEPWTLEGLRFEADSEPAILEILGFGSDPGVPPPSEPRKVNSRKPRYAVAAVVIAALALVAGVSLLATGNRSDSPSADLNLSPAGPIEETTPDPSSSDEAQTTNQIEESAPSSERLNDPGTEVDCSMEIPQVLPPHGSRSLVGATNCDHIAVAYNDTNLPAAGWDESISYCVLNNEEPLLEAWLYITGAQPGWIKLTNEESIFIDHGREVYDQYQQPSESGEVSQISYQDAQDKVAKIHIRGTAKDTSFMLSCKESWEGKNPETPKFVLRLLE